LILSTNEKKEKKKEKKKKKAQNDYKIIKKI
jgi:hypothetical protein